MDTIRKTIYDIDLSKQLQRIFSGVLLAKNDKQANRMGVNVYQDEQAVSLSGYTVKGYFIRSGVETLILTGAIDGNTAYVDLDAKCYHKDGSFSLSVVLCRDGREQTLVIYDGRVTETCTDTIVENENTLSLADIVQQEWVTNVLNAADTAMEQAGKAEEAAAEAQAIVDSIPPDYTEAVAKLNEKAPAIFADASGDLVHITDGAAMPVKSLITHIAPVETGAGEKGANNPWTISGWNAAELNFNGKNLLAEVVITSDQYLKALVRLQAGVTYTLSVQQMPDALYFSNESGSVDYAANTGSMSLTFTVRTTGGYSVIARYGGGANVAYNMMLEVGSTATAYEPYKQAQTLTASLPETVYGGTLDWGTGVLTVDSATKAFDGTESEWIIYRYNNLVAYIAVDNAKEGRLRASSHFQISNISSGAPAGTNCVAIEAISIGVTGPFFGISGIAETLDEWKAYLAAQYAAGTPVQIVYKLATPKAYQLTPQQLETLKGINNVWSDAGQTEVTYAADTKMYIDNLVTALVNGQKEE